MEDVEFLAVVLFFICSIAAGCVIQWGVSKIKVYKPPVSILWFLFGILICLLELCVIPKHQYTTNGHEESEIVVSPDSALGLISIGIAEASRMPHNALYYIVLPILLYDATQLVNWHHFKKNIKTGLMLAVSGIVLQVCVLGALMQWSFSQRSSTDAVKDSTVVRSLAAENSTDTFVLVRGPRDDLGLANATPTWRRIPLDNDAVWNKTIQESAPAMAAWQLVEDMAGDGDGAAATNRGMVPLPPDSPELLLNRVGGASSNSTEPSFASSCMIAAAVGATDPIAVLGVLEALDAPAQLVSLFDCESLINDGTAIFMFTFFKSMSRGGAVSWGSAAKEFLRLSIGGPVVGLVSAAILYRCIKHFRFHPFDVTLLVVAVSYLVFFVAEIYLETSGPLAIVVYGLYFKAYAKAAFDADTSKVHHTFVRGLATAMTSLVFIISGIACMRITWDTLTGQLNLEIPNEFRSSASNTLESQHYSITTVSSIATSSNAVRDLWHVPVFYLFCNLARGLMILLFSPLIKADLGSFTWKEGVLLWWGGLRGGVCLILALLIEQDKDIPQQLGSKAALYCASAVFLILVINGTTFEFLFRWLRPYKGNPFKELYLLKVLKFVDEEYEHEANLLQNHWLYQQTNILQFSNNLVPVLGDSTMHEMRGLQIPQISVRQTLDQLLIHQLKMPTVVTTQQSAENSRQTSPLRIAAEAAGLHPSTTSGPMPLHSSNIPTGGGGIGDASNHPFIEIKTDGIPNDLEMGVTDDGHDAAARIQNLKVGNRHDLDLVRTVEKLNLVPAAASIEDLDQPSLSSEPPLRKVCSLLVPGNSNLEATSGGQLQSQQHPRPLSENEEDARFGPSEIIIAAPPPSTQQNTADGEMAAESRISSKSVRWQEPEPNNLLPPPAPPVLSIKEDPNNNGGGAAARRTPLYKAGGYVYRIRSEPYSASLDVANTFRPPTGQRGSLQGLGDSSGFINKEADWASHFLTRRDSAADQQQFVPRTMSVPDHLGAAGRKHHHHHENQNPQNESGDVGAGQPAAETSSSTGVRRPKREDPQEIVRPWHREGEVVTMVVNSMRHLYRRMYEQSFISGTCLVAFMSSNDIVNDFAITENRLEKFRAMWTMLEHRNILDETIDGRPLHPLGGGVIGRDWKDLCCPVCDQQIKRQRWARMQNMIEHVTPFDVEWVLLGARLRLMSRWKSSAVRKLGRTCLCQDPRVIQVLDDEEEEEIVQSRRLSSTTSSMTASQQQTTKCSERCAMWWQKFLVWLWALVGPRQIFAALDDLQTLCAYVDVHEEMLVRGDRGLRFILGHKLLRSYSLRTARGKAAVRHLKDFYPESFPYALICHGAIFLINLKIQLVEEYHERGLLMTSDCELILEVLKRQIVKVTKYHPTYLFS